MVGTPPQPFYGRRILLATFVAQAISIGFTMSAYSLFIEPMEADLGASRAQMNLGISILISMAAFISPALGHAIDRGPARAIMLAGVVILAAGFILLSAATQLWQVGVLMALFIGIGHALFGPLPAMTIIANWYVRRRGTALGIAATGTTFAGFFTPLLAAFLIEHFSWRGALLVYAAASAAIALPAIGLLIVKRPEDVGQRPDGGLTRIEHGEASDAPPLSTAEILRSRDFWVIGAVLSLAITVGLTFIANVVPLASDLGVTRARAAWLLSCSAAFSLLGKLIFGFVVDRIGGRATLWIALSLQLAAWSVLMTEPGFGTLVGVTAVFALGGGSIMPVQGAIIGALFGRAHFGQVMGLMMPLTLLLPICGPPLAGHLHDVSGSYAGALQVFFAALVLSTLILWFARVPGEVRKSAGAELLKGRVG